MIVPEFYNESNLVTQYLNKGATHYPQKELVSYVGTTPYTLSHGEDMYSLARDLFGASREYLWTVIAEVNDLRLPDDWEAGETVQIPNIIVNSLDKTEIDYTNVKTDTTKIPSTT